MTTTMQIETADKHSSTIYNQVVSVCHVIVYGDVATATATQTIDQQMVVHLLLTVCSLCSQTVHA